jgi:hypothetical protein
MAIANKLSRQTSGIQLLSKLPKKLFYDFPFSNMPRLSRISVAYQ